PGAVHDVFGGVGDGGADLAGRLRQHPHRVGAEPDISWVADVGLGNHAGRLLQRAPGARRLRTASSSPTRFIPFRASAWRWRAVSAGAEWLACAAWRGRWAAWWFPLPGPTGRSHPQPPA